MPDNLPGIVMFVLMAALYALLFWRFLGNLFAPKRTVKARVIGKNTVESYSKLGRNGKQTKYVVIFESQGKKISFCVSEFSYGGYRKGESGMLTYKGDRLIGFE